MTRFETDTEMSFDFTLRLFASSQGAADAAADAFITRIFGNALSGLLDLQSVTNTPLTGQDVSGANYEYTYSLDQKSGTDPDFNIISAPNAAEALAELRSDAIRRSQLTEMPIVLNHLKAV